VLGGVDVVEGRVTGLVSVAGPLVAVSFTAEGTFEVVGAVEVRDTLAIDGTSHFGTAVHAGALTSDGSLRSSADVRVDRTLTVTGLFETPSAHVGALLLSGSAEIPGELAGGALVRAHFRGNSQIGTVRAPKVVLRGAPAGLVPTLIRYVFGGGVAVSVDRIEADTVELSSVDVKSVHAREIVLGPAAHVTTLVGQVVKKHPSARVGYESRTPPPHGLRR
jgi:cytoskeletal protein CcmA (bactofilin family)